LSKNDVSVTEALGTWAATWAEPQPTAALEKARVAFYDAAACMVAGAGDEGASAVRKTIGAWGMGASTVVGSSQAAGAPLAALANGTAAHALDYDDGIHLGPVHISAVLVPALMALAEERKASGRRVLEAYIVGTEILAQVAQGVGRFHYGKGWHSTPTYGTIAAAAACGRLLGLDAQSMAHCIGLSVSMAAGTKAQFGSMAKPLHAGMAAKNGVLAAALAEQGVTAAKDPLDSPMGFRRLYGTDESPGWSELLPQMGKPLAIERFGLGFKFYPCCRATHRSLDGVLELRQQHGFGADDLASMETTVGFSASQNLMYPLPENEMQARFSMQYCTAVAIAAGRVVLSDFTPEAVRRPEIRALLPRIRMICAPPSANDDSLLKRDPTGVKIVLKDGRVLETSVQHALGTPHKPMNDAQISAKFQDCTRGFLAAAKVAAAESILKAFAETPEAGALMKALRFEALADHGQRFAARG
jgi:2-methylcitrate dehydratase PrpD